MATVIVTDGDERSSLAVVRSLGRAGHRVIVGARGDSSLAGASRHAAGNVSLPDALLAPDASAEAVGVAARAHGCDLVLPTTDAASLALLARPDAILPAVVPMPTLSIFRRVSDKAEVASVAAPLGIAVPRQAVADSRAQVSSLVNAVRPPLVLKPARSVADAGRERRKHGVTHARDWAEAVTLTATMADSAFPLLVQERVVGPGIGVFLLLWDNKLVAAFAHRRLREKPPSGGVSVLCESVSLDPQLLAQSEALLKGFGWSGVAMVEYKIDARSGTPYLMEINGRFWGSLQLAIDAGVDFPALLVDAALGRAVAPVTRWREGVRGRWLWGDADHVATRLRHRDAALHLPPDAPTRLATVLGFAGGLVPPWRDQVLRLSDPAPALYELLSRLRKS